MRALWYFFGFVAAAGVLGGAVGLAMGMLIGSGWERYHRSRRALRDLAPLSSGPMLAVHEAAGGAQAFAAPQSHRPEGADRPSSPAQGPRLQLVPPALKADPAASPLVLVVAAFGALVPNGFFVVWLISEYQGLSAVFSNHLAMGFILDAFLATVILAVYFARHPIGAVRWPIFLLLSLVGGLGFSLPLYWWLNRRRAV